MTSAQAIFIVGGLVNLTFSTLAGFFLYWIRVRDPAFTPPRYALITHNSSTINGILLLALSVPIVHAGFPEPIAIGIASAEVIATFLSSGRNVVLWRRGVEDAFRDAPDLVLRLRGFGNLIHFVVMSALLYGVTRTALGI